MITGYRKFVWLAMAGLIGFSLLPAAEASTINIQLSDQEITYLNDMGGTIFDSSDQDGGNLDPTEADILTSATFNLDGNAPPASGGNNVIMLGDGSGPLYGDFLIDNVGASIPISNVMLSTIGGGGVGFGYDLFTSPAGVPLLRLELDEMQILLNAAVVLITGKANVVGQDLPFNLAFDTSQQVDFAYTATQPGIVGSTVAELFIAGGTVNISGQMFIPEPSCLGLLFTCAAGVALAFGRRTQLPVLSG